MPITQCVIEMVKAVFQVPGMQRVFGKPGLVGRVMLTKFGVDFDMYLSELGLPGYWPMSLMVSVSTCADIQRRD